MRDVATASGVSPATVSFVLSGTAKQTISPATRSRVEAAAASLGYVPHGLARALREGTSRIVLLNLDPRMRGGSIDSYIVGLEDELALAGYTLLVRHGASARTSLTAVTESISPRAVIDLAELYSNQAEGRDGGWVNGLAAHTAVQLGFLVRAGHERIAMAVPVDLGHGALADARLELALATAKSLGLPPVEQLVVPDDPAAATASLAAFTTAHPAVTAVAAYDDGVAIRVLAAARDLGVDVPGSLAVIGFDATDLGAFVSPPLTSVRIDGERFGRSHARAALGLPTSDGSDLAATVVRRASA